MSIAIFSDLHLKNTADSEDANLLHSILKKLESKQLSEIWFLGDIFDLFVGPYSFYHRLHGQIFHQLRLMKNNGTRILWLEGNHDFYLEKVLSPYGIEVKDEIIDSQINTSPGKTLRLHLAHGDLVNQEDAAYLKWRGATRHPIFRFALNTIPSFIAEKALLPFAELKSSQSRKKTYQYMRDQEQVLRTLYRKYADQKFAEGFNGVFLGHCHIQDLYVRDQNFYFNMGSWIGTANLNPRSFGLWNTQNEAFPKHILASDFLSD